MNIFQGELKTIFVQSVLEWLVFHKIFYKDITLDKRFDVAVLP